MTTTAGVWADRPASRAEVAPVQDRAPIAFWLSVMILLLFTQPWVVVQIEQAHADSFVAKVMFFPCYFAGLYLFFQKPWPAIMGVMREPFMVVLFGVATASVFWSVAPDLTSRRIVALGLTMLCGVAMGARWRWSQMVDVVAVSFAIMAVLSLLLGVLLPSVGRMTTLFPGAWRGLWIEKNTLGELMAFGALIFAAAALYQPRRALFWWAMVALAVLLIGLSQSKTSLVAFVLGAGGMGFTLLVRRGGPMAVVATWATVTGFVLLVATIVIAPDLFLGLLGKDATLTGRTKIWAAIWRLIQERPVLGYGYGAVWSDQTGWGPVQWIIKQAGFRPEHAHDTWLEQWLGMGLVGLVAFAAFYLSTLAKTIWAVFTNRGALIAFPFLIVYSMATLTESAGMMYNDLRWMMLVSFAIRLSLPDEEKRAAARPRPPRAFHWPDAPRLAPPSRFRSRR